MSNNLPIQATSFIGREREIAEVIFVATAERMDCHVHDLMGTTGPYDIVSVIEAPDHEAATTLMLAIEMQSNVRTQMMRAYRKDDMKKILGRLP